LTTILPILFLYLNTVTVTASYKGKVKTHNYINRQNQSTTENCENRNDPDLVQAFLKKWWVESDFKAPNLPIAKDLIWVSPNYISSTMDCAKQVVGHQFGQLLP
jgi:hypothetical protein